jgi:hypothetical protein
MIDAGMTSKRSDSEKPNNVVQTNYITVEGNIDRDLYDEIMVRQRDELNTKLLIRGVKG